MTELFAESAYVGVAALDDAGRREQVARAHAIAVLAHRGQVDKLGGKALVGHGKAVYSLCIACRQACGSGCRKTVHSLAVRTKGRGACPRFP